MTTTLSRISHHGSLPNAFSGKYGVMLLVVAVGVSRRGVSRPGRHAVPSCAETGAGMIAAGA